MITKSFNSLVRRLLAASCNYFYFVILKRLVTETPVKYLRLKLTTFFLPKYH